MLYHTHVRFSQHTSALGIDRAKLFGTLPSGETLLLSQKRRPLVNSGRNDVGCDNGSRKAARWGSARLETLSEESAV